MDLHPRIAVIQEAPFTFLPILVVHADWSVNPNKRWMAIAETDGNCFRVQSPELVGDLSNFLNRMQKRIGLGGCVLIGFDFPIGLPYTYAQLMNISSFLSSLTVFGKGEWSSFFEVANSADQISHLRPFYPNRPGEALRQHLLDKLGIGSFDELLRTCDKAPPLQRPAAPLFWTLGPQQVGKAAINGWQQILAPGLNNPDLNVSIWPFSGKLSDLLKPGRVIIVETYPTESIQQLGLVRSDKKFSKRRQTDRISAAERLFNGTFADEIEIDPQLEENLLDGFGSTLFGEDRFDAVVGVIGMLEYLSGKRHFFEPKTDKTRQIEGWIFGLASEKVIV